jgi:CelD/BcsL family acetyltransferase involved in cellulose biosynthesis
VFEIILESSYNFLSAEYLELFAGSRASAFQHPLWLDRLYAKLARRLNAEPIVITARRRHNGQLAMLLPLLRRRHGAVRVIEFADLQVSDYAAPVCDDITFAQLASDREARERIRAHLKPYDLLRVQKIGQNAPPLEQLFGVDRRTFMGMSAHAVELSAPFSQWQMENIAPSYRKELDKKRRQLNRKGAVRFECARDPELIKSTFYAMREYRKERFEGRDLLQQPLYFDFYMDIALHGGTSGFSRTYTLSVNGQPIGGVWGLFHQGHFLVLLGGFDLNTYKNQSIGALTFSDIAHDCIERGDVLLDFTIGDESYKRLFGARPSSMWMISAAGTPLGAAANFVAEKVPWAVKAAKELLHRRQEAAAAPAEGTSLRRRLKDEPGG